MLTIAEYKNEKQVEGYFEEHLSSGEYHTEKGQSDGIWVGKTTQEFGIKEGSVITSHDFSNLVRGVDPKTGKSFLIRKKSNRVIAREMLFSAPKTVSIMAITLEDHRLKAAHDKAVAGAFKELETLTQTRVRRGFWINHDEKRTTGNLIAARFTHETSRELDPQLHSHNVVFNVTLDATEGRLKALDPNFIYNSTNYLSEVYRSILAKEVKSLGYEIEGGRHTWKIKGVSREIESMFSKRTAQIDKAAKKLQDKKGVDVDTRGRALIAGLTRKAKDHDVNSSDYLAFQKSQLSKAQMKDLETLKNDSVENAKNVKIIDSKAIAKESVEYALKHIFERASVVHKHELIKESLKHAQGDAQLKDILHELSDKKFLHRGDWVMTREERQREIEILQIIRSGKRKFDQLLPDSKINLDSKLSDDQRFALLRILENKDQFQFLRGVAGAGKTFALTELKNNLAQKNVLFLAPSGSATETLREENLSNSKTLQLFLQSEDVQKSASNSLIVVDEAGLISTKQMSSFLKIAKDIDARVLFVGDTLQHNSVEGGDALRLIEDYSVIEKIDLSTVRRQTSGKYRQAIQSLARGDVHKGWEVLDEQNVIKEVKDESRFKEIAQEYTNAVLKDEKTLIVCPTNDEITKVTNEVRIELKKVGKIAEIDHSMNVFKSLNFTTIEKQYTKNFEDGMNVSFHRNDGKFKQGEVWEVKTNKDGSLSLQNKDKESVKFEPSKAFKSFDVVVSEKKEFSQGDKILIKANYATSRENKLLNGSVVQIAKILDDGSIKLTNGKTIEKDFRHFTHGYALTSQASQGKTADRVILSASSKSGMALSKNQFYVSCSRGKNNISVYTEDKDRLKEAVVRSSSRKLVLEELVRDRIVMKRIQAANIGLQKAVEKSRDIIERTFAKRKQKSISKVRMSQYKKIEKDTKGVSKEY